MTQANDKPITNLKQNYYKNSDLKKIFGATNAELKYYTSKVQTIYKEFSSHTVINSVHYYHKDEIEKFIKTAQELDYSRPIELIKDMHSNNTLNGEAKTRARNLDIVYLNKKKYLATTLVAERFNVSPSSIRDNYKRGKFSDTHKVNNRFFIAEDEVISLENYLKETIPFIDIDSSILSESEKTQMRNKNQITAFFPNARKFQMFSKRVGYRVPYKDIEEYKTTILPIKRASENEKRKFLIAKTPEAKYDVLTECINSTMATNTIELFHIFAHNQLSDADRVEMDNLIRNYATTAIRLETLLDTEIYSLTNKKIESFIKSELFTSTDRQIIGVFLKKLLQLPDVKCRYTKNFSRYIIASKSKSRDKEVYSFETWLHYETYLKDVYKHIFKSFENRFYAEKWLFCLLHMCISWRTKDIKQIPPLHEIDELEIYDLDWFLNNDFRISDAQRIINLIKDLYMDNIRASKNKVTVHFAPPPHLVLPLSIAFITANYHALNHHPNSESIFSISRFQVSVFRSFFEPKELKEFSNAKACRSLITHIYTIANASTEMADVAFSLSTYMRSHKLQEGNELSETTSQYIHSSKSDGPSSTVAEHLFRRGEFGWLYNTLIGIASGEVKTLEDATKNIEHLKGEIVPYSVDSYSGVLLSEYDSRKEVINELLSQDSNSVKETLVSLSHKKRPSKNEFAQCIKYDGERLACPYKTNTSCSTCNYLIPTNYMLSIIKVELYSLLNKLDDTNVDDYVYRQKYTHLITKLLVFINEARKEFDVLDKDYISSFIDLQDVKQKVDKLKHEKYLRINRRENHK